MAKAEYSVNCRPLTHVSDDLNDDRSLTLNDFLQMIPGGVQGAHGAPGSFTDGDMLCRQWQVSQCLVNQFGRRWIKEYLPAINLHSKWRKEQRDLQVNYIVVSWDNNASRNQLKKGRVAAVYPGKEGWVRVADIQTATGILRRPVAKLCPLNVF